MKINRLNIEDDVFILLRFCVLGEERRNPLDFEINLGFLRENLIVMLYYMRIEFFFCLNLKIILTQDVNCIF
jgi:hypothetical protein